MKIIIWPAKRLIIPNSSTLDSHTVPLNEATELIETLKSLLQLNYQN